MGDIMGLGTAQGSAGVDTLSHQAIPVEGFQTSKSQQSQKHPNHTGLILIPYLTKLLLRSRTEKEERSL
jgi:hypothetical protein